MTAKQAIEQGLALAADGRFADAALAFCRAIKIDPQLAEAYQDLGEVLLPLERLQEAADCFCRAIELQPVYPEAYNHLGVVLKKQERLPEAEECLRQAIAQKGDYAVAFHNLGNCLKAAGRLAEAEEAYLRAIGLDPELALSRYSLATLYLSQGQFQKGWPLHEARLRRHGAFRLPIAPWRGEDLTGRRILLYYEQGFGDTFQFSRYAYEVARLAAATTVWLQKPLARLFRGQSAFTVVDDGRTIDPQDYDYACSLYSLPAVFTAADAPIPVAVPYIEPPPEAIAAWRQRLAGPAGGRFRVGVVWAGNPAHDNDKNRSIPIAQFARLFTSERPFWVSLQVAHPDRRPATRRRLFDPTGDLTDFAETAALIANLDLVIAVDTAVAHLAGVMGKKTWILLPFRSEWRWGRSGDTSLWYPTVRLFRQRRLGDWPEVLARTKAALADEIAGHP
jgi:tetratricopeptide (TPR) repeat protein